MSKESLALDFFSSLVLDNSIVDESGLAFVSGARLNKSNLSNEVLQDPHSLLPGDHSEGVGPFKMLEKTPLKYAYDLRVLHEKGGLSYSHPIYYKALITTALNEGAALSNIDHSKLDELSLIKALLSNFAFYHFCHAPKANYCLYDFNDFIQKKKLKTNSIVLRDFLFTCERNIITFDVFNFIDTSNLYIDLANGLYLGLGSRPGKREAVSSFHKVLTGLFLPFYDKVLLNNSKGAIAKIRASLSENNIDSIGLNIMKKAEMRYSHCLQSEEANYLNIPSSITTSQLKLLMDKTL